MSDAETGSCSKWGAQQNRLDTHCGGAASIRSRVVDDDVEDDENAFTRSGAVTVKSGQQSPDGSFTAVESARGHDTDTLNHRRSAECSDQRNGVNTGCDGGPAEQAATVADETTGADCELRSFLAQLGLGKYADVFRDQDVDLPMLLTLSEDDLKEVGIR